MASPQGFDAGGHRPGSANRPKAAGESLRRLVGREVIPRLLVAHAEHTPHLDKSIAPPGPRRIDANEAERFARLALSREAHALLDEAEAYLQRGVDAQTLFVDLLAPAARVLGRGWEDDSIDFLEVTMGLWRLQEVLREIAAHSPVISGGSMRSALFSPIPDEQHSFGAAMVAESFAQAGWDAELLIDAPRSDLLGRVAGASFDLVGLTISCDCHIDRLRPLITAIRSVSSNPQLGIMIGGRVPTLNPGLAVVVGADGSADTATDAVAAAERLLEHRRRALAV